MQSVFFYVFFCSATVRTVFPLLFASKSVAVDDDDFINAAKTMYMVTVLSYLANDGIKCNKVCCAYVRVLDTRSRMKNTMCIFLFVIFPRLP